MAYVHVAHDCRLGNHLILANAASLAGHITIGDHAIIGGLTGIHQHVRIRTVLHGRRLLALSGRIFRPFMRAAAVIARGCTVSTLWACAGKDFRPIGFSVLKRAYDMLFRSGHRTAEAAKLAKAEFGDQPDVMTVLAFLEETKRGICRSVGKDQEDEE